MDVYIIQTIIMLILVAIIFYLIIHTKCSPENRRSLIVKMLNGVNHIFFVELVTVDASLGISSLFKEVKGNLRELSV